MSESYISKLTNLYDKTTLKGIYLFLSFTIISYVFYLNGIITNEIIANPTNSIDEYIVLLSFVSLTTAFLYFIKIENVIFRLYLRLKGHVGGYHRFRNVNYRDSFNSIFISRERKEFITQILFWISTIFLLLLSLEITFFYSTFYYFGLILIFMIIILVFDIIVVSWKIPLHIMNIIQQSNNRLKELQGDLSNTKRKLRVAKDSTKQKELESLMKKINNKIRGYRLLIQFYDIITPMISHLTLTLTCVFLIIFVFLIPFNPFSLFLLIFQFMILISFSLK